MVRMERNSTRWTTRDDFFRDLHSVIYALYHGPINFLHAIHRYLTGFENRMREEGHYMSLADLYDLYMEFEQAIVEFLDENPLHTLPYPIPEDNVHMGTGRRRRTHRE